MKTPIKITKGKFEDGFDGWRIGQRQTNGTNGYEIHYTDDGECVTDHVYTFEDAKLISSSPKMLELLIKFSNINNPAKEHISESLIKELEELLKPLTQ